MEQVIGYGISAAAVLVVGLLAHWLAKSRFALELEKHAKDKELLEAAVRKAELEGDSLVHEHVESRIRLILEDWRDRVDRAERTQLKQELEIAGLTKRLTELEHERRVFEGQLVHRDQTILQLGMQIGELNAAVARNGETIRRQAEELVHLHSVSAAASAAFGATTINHFPLD